MNKYLHTYQSQLNFIIDDKFDPYFFLITSEDIKFVVMG